MAFARGDGVSACMGLRHKTPGSLDSSLRGASSGLLTVQEASQTRKQNQNKQKKNKTKFPSFLSLHSSG